MNQKIARKGPLRYRSVVMVLNITFGLLVYWFLGFVMSDISNQPGPDLGEIQKKYQNPALVKESDSINAQIQSGLNAINEQQKQQEILEKSINSYRDTMNQLLDLQKVSIQKGVALSSGTEKNLGEITTLYLHYQKQFQDINQLVTQNNLKIQRLQNINQHLKEQINQQNDEGLKEYNYLWVKHNWIMAGLQLLVLVPCLLMAYYLFIQYRKTVYISMVITIGVAVFFKITMVMHDYFPSYLFKYILVLFLIYFTGKVLIAKLKLVSSPNRLWLDKQYSEAYQKGKCPLCEFSIKPSIAKFVITEKGTTVPFLNYQYLDKVKAYTCPCCGEQLFEECSHCTHLRYSLLTYCDSCGVRKKE